MLLKIARRSNTLQIPSKGFQGTDTQLLQSGAHILPKGCVLLGVLKSIENELRNREMLGMFLRVGSGRLRPIPTADLKRYLTIF